MTHIVDAYYESYQLLHAGNYTAGFRLFEHRWNSAVIATLPEPFVKLTPQPAWAGQSLLGKSITVQMEMGYGDCIQFARFIPLLKVLGAKCVTVLQTRSLHNLFAPMECIDYLTNDEKSAVAVETDYWLGSMSLAALALHAPAYARTLFPITGSKIVGSEGYLTAEPSSITPGVGVTWSASHGALHQIKSTTSAVIQQLVPDAYSLNPDSDADFTPLPDDGWKQDWSLTARHMQAMTAVVTVDTGTAHLAGALGVPCIVLLPDAEHVCWRWKNACWYDSVVTLQHDQWSRVPELLAQWRLKPVQVQSTQPPCVFANPELIKKPPAFVLPKPRNTSVVTLAGIVPRKPMLELVLPG
jgi:hypothetical protein